MTASRSHANRLWGLYYRLLTGIVRDSAAEVGKLDIDIKEFFVLDDVEAWPYPAELARRLSIPKATLTGYLKSLEAKGLVRREIDADDLRRHRLTITPAGRKTVDGARAIVADRFAGRLARLDAGEQERLQRLLEKLAD